MLDKRKCPACIRGHLTRTEGKLEQSGSTYLPTAVWTCDVCGLVKYEPAVAARWLPAESAEDAAPCGGLARAA